VVRVSGAIADVTDRKRSAEELRLRAELLDLAHDAVIVREPAESRVTFWNREAEAIYGYSHEEAIGRVTHELLGTVFPESREAVDEALARDGRWDGELRHTRKDGRVIVVMSRQALQRDHDGRPLAIIELNSDITEHKRSEVELAYTSGLLERTQVISKTGGWEYDLATRRLTRTGEVYRIFGDERPDLPIELEEAIAGYGPESAPIIGAAFQRLVTKGEPYDLELGVARLDGERIWLRVTGQPVLEDGRIVRVGGIIADVTDRRRAEEEIRTLNAELEQRVVVRTADLERANRELETFAYSVSHDLRAPLRAVDAFSQLLRDEYGDGVGEEGRHYLERVRAGAVRMGDLVDAVLQLSRLSRRRLVRVPVDMSALASEIVADLQGGEPDRRVDVEVQEALLAEADLALVRSVLQNLLANAYKFTSETAHPRVRFGAVEQNGVPVYFVADNGAGFNMAHAKGLLLPFHRLHRDSEFPGEGIGLATVVRAVHRHGGVVWAHGAVNRGATFHFSLMPGAHPPADAATGEDVIPAWQPSDGADGLRDD
jgi:PAS domain S-box-containing protein